MAELVRGQFDEPDPRSAASVTAASVLGRRATFDVLAHATETPEDELIALLRLAVDSGLLTESEPDVFIFHDDLAC